MIKASEKIKQIIEDQDILDLTHLKTYTIDEENSHEIDDGISYEFKENKNFRPELPVGRLYLNH